MQNFENTKFESLEIIQTLAQTHSSSTKIYLCRYNNMLQVCKSIQKKSIISDSKAIQHIKNQKQALKYFTYIKCGYVCQIYGTFQDQDHLYFMLEMVEGLPLHKVLGMMGRGIGGRAVRVVGWQVAEIMRRFHGEGYIYRDIKSSNFMIDRKGRIKMIDLGKAKKIGRERTYTICGTTHAMPPQIHKTQGYSYQFDYYSFGILLYQLSIGTSPFGYGNSNKKILEQIQTGITQTMLNKIQDKQCRDLIEKLLKKDGGERLGSKGGFAEILEHGFFQEETMFAKGIFQGQDQMGEFDEEFCQLVSEIQDLGIYAEKYEEMTQDDPFYKFL